MIKILIFVLFTMSICGAFGATTEFIRNGRPVGVMRDTVTPANSVPFPVLPLNASGATVNIATEETLSAFSAKLPQPVSFAGDLILVDGSRATQPVSQSGAMPWTVSLPQDPIVLQGGAPWTVSVPQDLNVNVSNQPSVVSVTQGTNPWVVSVPLPSTVTQGTSPWVISAPQDFFVKQSGSPWIVSVPVASDVKLKDAAGVNVTLGQKAMTSSLPVVMASDQGPIGISMPQAVSGSFSTASLVGTTASTITKPVNAIGFVLQAPDVNTDNIRWAIGSTASTTVGLQLQPGRDSGFIPVSANVSVCAEASGTNAFDIQWIVK